MTLAFPQDMTAKTTPVDADILLIADSADSNASKKVTIANLKTDIIVDASTATDETWSADKINTQLATKAASSHTHAASDIVSWTLTHERGGLEADVSAYNWLVKITWGASSAVTAPSGTIVWHTDSIALTNKTIDPSLNTIDGDKLDITWNPTNYTPTDVTETDDVDDLSAHLKGIDTALGILHTYKNGSTTKNLADASATQNIAHWLSGTPKQIRLNVVFWPSNALPTTIATVVYNGTTSSVVGSTGTSTTRVDANDSGAIKITATGDDTAYQSGVITFDSTNIIITWTKQGSPTGTVPILWEATT